MARRILNRKELRADFDAAEQRTQGETEDQEEEELEDEEEDTEENGEAEGEASEDEAEDGQPIVKKRKAPKAAKPTKAKPRTRTQKIVRMKVVWVVFNNSNQRVAAFEYPRRQEALDHAAKLTIDKKTTHFVQPVKEPIEDK